VSALYKSNAFIILNKKNIKLYTFYWCYILADAVYLYKKIGKDKNWVFQCLKGVTKTGIKVAT
jgi:hypothetical protein